MATTINGRTPEEIKNGLECCSTEGLNCFRCKYNDACDTDLHTLEHDALALIQQLEEQVVDLNKTSKQLERERDAAVENLPHLCILCKFQPTNFKEKLHAKCTTCIKQRNWEWMGPQEAN